MAKFTLSTAVSRGQNAARAAFDLARSGVGTQKSSEVAIYEKLKPVHFDAIAQTYGQDAVLRYIKVMEAKRMKDGPNDI